MLEKTFNAMITMRRLTSFARFACFPLQQMRLSMTHVCTYRQFSLADYTLYKPLRRLYGLVDCEKQHPEVCICNCTCIRSASAMHLLCL